MYRVMVRDCVGAKAYAPEVFATALDLLIFSLHVRLNEVLTNIMGRMVSVKYFDPPL